MTTKMNTQRGSTCAVCKKRLSYQTESGEIKWHESHVVDEGLYCQKCFVKSGAGKVSKKSRENA